MLRERERENERERAWNVFVGRKTGGKACMCVCVCVRARPL